MRRVLLLAVLCGCPKTTAVPDAGTPTAPPSSSAVTSASAAPVRAAPPKALGDLVALVRAWNDATNAHDATKLGELYADNVKLYGQKMTREKAVAIKNAAFAKHDRDDLGRITFNTNRATFHKTSKSKDGKTIEVSGYIDVDASMKITAEGDTTTDANVARKKATQCSDAVRALVESTAEGKQAMTNERWIEPPAHSGDPWVVKYISVGGGDVVDKNTRTGLMFTSDGFDVDARAGTVKHTGWVMQNDNGVFAQSAVNVPVLTGDAHAAATVRTACN